MNYNSRLMEVRQTQEFIEWLRSLKDARAQQRIAQRIIRVQAGLLGDAKFFDGIGEFRVDYGPGYRVYFVQQSKAIIILLCGGDKSTQQRTSPKLGKWRRKFEMPIETTPFDASEFIATSEAQIELLSDAFETGDPSYIAHALGVVAKARGMSAVAKEAGVTRETLYKALNENGDPRLSTFMGVTRALGLQLQLAPVPEKRKAPIKRAPSKSTEPVRKKTIKAA